MAFMLDVRSPFKWNGCLAELYTPDRYILASGHLFIALYRMVSALDALKLGADMANKYLFDSTIPINRGKDIVYIIIVTSFRLRRTQAKSLTCDTFPPH